MVKFYLLTYDDKSRELVNPVPQIDDGDYDFDYNDDKYREAGGDVFAG